MNLMNVVAGPAPKLRARCRLRQWLLAPWAAALAIAAGAIAWRAAFAAEGAAAVFVWALCLAGAGFAGGWLRTLARAGLAEYRTRFPSQSLDGGRWARLPFLGWPSLYAFAGAAAMAAGAFSGLCSSTVARSPW